MQVIAVCITITLLKRGRPSASMVVAYRGLCARLKSDAIDLHNAAYVLVNGGYFGEFLRSKDNPYCYDLT